LVDVCKTRSQFPEICTALSSQRRARWSLKLLVCLRPAFEFVCSNSLAQNLGSGGVQVGCNWILFYSGKIMPGGGLVRKRGKHRERESEWALFFMHTQTLHTSHSLTHSFPYSISLPSQGGKKRKQGSLTKAPRKGCRRFK
jgi:hypothetical protein